MGNEKLLLRLRAESMSADLERLKNHLQSVPDRRRDLDDLTITLKNASDQISEIRVKLIRLLSNLSDEDQDKIDQDVKSAKRSIMTVMKSIESMKAKCFRVDESPIGADFAESLNTRTATARQDVDRIRNDLKSSKPPGSIWESLRKAMSSHTEPIFSEYVEFLGGVALRDTGFDEGISKVADELWKSYAPGGGRSNFIAIPTRQQTLQHTFARIIRVTFPDWTIWSLPATALEFWKVVASKSIDETLKAIINNLPPDQQAMADTKCREQLGDAYATYTMGPAYALFSLSLMFDPADDDQQNRVRAVLAMLECMDKKESTLNPPYQEVRRRLLQAWNEARAQLDRPSLDLDLDNPSSADTSDARGAGVRVVVNALWRTLGSMTSAGFVVDVWNEIQSWIPDLLAGNAERIPIAAGTEMRHVLNAAWMARVSPDREIPLEALTKAVQQLRDLVLQKGK